VIRFRIWITIAVAFSAIVGTVLHAQLSDEEKRKIFLKTRSADSDESPTATPKRKTKKTTAKKKSPTPTPKPKAKPSKTPEPETPTPAPKKKKSAQATKSKTKHKSTAKKSPSAKAKETKTTKEKAKPEKTPTPHKIESAKTSPTPVERPTAALPRAIPMPSPEERAQVVVEKSRMEEQGLAPTPSPPPRRFLFWGGSSRSSSGGNYRYLTRSIIEEIRRAPVQRRRWQFIVVHNSGTRQGNARVFDYYHRHVRRMQNGLAYHFVIGNGTSTGNGQIEVGDRWRRQINGGHVHSDYLNNISLGICLVGDFNRDQPTRAQLECCEELIRYLRERCGKIDNHDVLVRPHREMNPPRWATDCPGNVFPYSWFRRFN
jgi:hypothetical protein